MRVILRSLRSQCGIGRPPRPHPRAFTPDTKRTAALTPSAERTQDVFRFFFRAYPSRTAIMVFLMVTAGLAEGVGVVTLIPILQLTEGGEAPPNRVGEGIVRLIEGLHLQPTLGVLLALIVIAISVKSALLFFAQRQVGYTVAGVTRDLRLDLMRSLMEVRWSYFVRRTPGQFANAVVNEARRAATAYQEATASLAALFQMMAYLLIAVLVAWEIAVMALLAGGGITLLARVFFGMMRRSGETQTTASKSLASRLIDVLQGVKALKAMGREGLVWPLLEHETQMLNTARRQEVFAGQALRSAQEPILTLIMAVGLYLVMGVSGLPFSATLVMAFIFYRLVTHINTLQGRYQMILLGESAFFSFQNELAAIQAEREVSAGTRAFQGLTEGISLDDLRFNYGDSLILSGVSAFIPKGSFVTIHGESGSGKTTLADLIVGLHEPTGGEILVNGIPLGELDMAAWRRSLGYVPQEMLLFNESVLMNVTLGDPTFSKAEVERALKVAGAWEFVSEKAGGMDAPMGERGGMLSGGQRQRIALARALVGSPSLLILDEFTSALDPVTERAVCETLRKLAGKVTILAISHQPVLQDAADLVYRMEGGKLVLLSKKVAEAIPLGASTEC